MIIIYFKWIKVFFRNFPQYELIRIGKERGIIFWKTGHCLHFSNPYGLSAQDIKILRKHRMAKGLLYRILY